MARQTATASRLTRLHADGFDQSTHERCARTVRVSCSQCQALVINGIACHETGCPHQTYTCKGCDTRVARRGTYCVSPAGIITQTDTRGHGACKGVHTMKAIRTFYKGPGNVRGARIYATDDDGNRCSIPYPHEATRDDGHRQAARALCAKMGWRGRMVEGQLGTDHVFVWIGELTADQPFGVPHDIHIAGRRWFHKRYGNTYHSVTITVDGATHTLGAVYGYGEAYLQTAWGWLHEHGYLPTAYGGTLGLRQAGITYAVVDVAREGDL